MSTLADIQYNLSTDILKSKLSIEERAQILCDITQSLGWESYDLSYINGDWCGVNREKAVKDLQFIDNEKKS